MEAPMSNLGFFSKPFIETKEGPRYGRIIKKYPKNLDKGRLEKLKSLHDDYLIKLSKTGLIIPDTEAVIEDNGFIIIQEAFNKEELIREILQNANLEEFTKYLVLIYDDILMFMNYIKLHQIEDLGYHPTTRNYALRKDELIYFDTFPPMNIDQKSLNRIILDFLPIKLPSFLKMILSPFLGIVSDEYFQFDKMFIGVTGSCCRLRPEYKDQILDVSKTYFSEKIEDQTLKEKLLILTSKPPKLSFIWTYFRRIFGKEGRPNI